MTSPQLGILALGTASQAYIEVDLHDGQDATTLARAVASLRGLRTTLDGVNLVVGFRPELWREVAPDAAPERLSGFNADLKSDDGFTMPATQHDAVLWAAGAAYDAVFDVCRRAIAVLASAASPVTETTCWPYRHDHDLTGFIDGSENPDLAEAPHVALVAEGLPGAGGSVLLLQKWVHHPSWQELPDGEQELVIGRTKADGIELEHKPADCHVAKTDQDHFGKIFRRNQPWGCVTDHGTMFVGFCADQRPLATMLESMTGLGGDARDALTRYTDPVSGAYYFVPSIDDLLRFDATD
jgi:porphyrinogen peroxidase